MRESHDWKRMLATIGLAAVLIAAGVTATAYGLIRHARSHGRPYGIQASITDSQASLMELSPVPARAAPGNRAGRDTPRGLTSRVMTPDGTLVAARVSVAGRAGR
jgi:hypothetical protein